MDAETSTAQTGANKKNIVPTDSSPADMGRWDRNQYYGVLIDGRGNTLAYRASPERKSVSIMSPREYKLWAAGTDARSWDEVHANRQAIEKTLEKKKSDCKTCNKSSETSAINSAKQKTGIVQSVKRFAKGVPGAIKANIGADKAPEDVAAKRQSICESCDIYNFGICDSDKGGCGCVLSWKVKLASESCPKEKWTSVSK